MKGSRMGYLPVLLLAGLCRCGVLFDTPMPVATAPLAEFPAGIIGRYHLADSSFVEKDTIYNATYYEQALPAKDSIAMFAVDLTIEKKLAYFTLKVMLFCKSCPEEAGDKSNKRYEAFKNKDTKTYKRDVYTVYEKLRIDTIINLKKKDKLKHDGKAYYLNRFLPADKAWEIFRLKATGKDAFTLGLTNAKDKKHLERFVVKKKLVGATVHLSDEQFYAFVKQGGFHLKLRFRK